MRVQVPIEARGVSSSEPKVTGGFEPPTQHWRWVPNLGPWQMQHSFLTGGQFISNA